MFPPIALNNLVYDFKVDMMLFFILDLALKKLLSLIKATDISYSCFSNNSAFIIIPNWLVASTLITKQDVSWHIFLDNTFSCPVPANNSARPL